MSTTKESWQMGKNLTPAGIGTSHLSSVWGKVRSGVGTETPETKVDLVGFRALSLYVTLLSEMAEVEIPVLLPACGLTGASWPLCPSPSALQLLSPFQIFKCFLFFFLLTQLGATTLWFSEMKLSSGFH